MSWPVGASRSGRGGSSTRFRRGQLRAGTTMWPALGGAIALFAVASIEGLIWPQLLGCVLLAMITLSLLAVVRAPRLTVDVDVPKRITVGEPFDVAIRMVNHDRWSQRALLVTHRLHAPRRLAPDAVVFIARLSGRSEAVVRVAGEPIARGAANGSDVEIVVGGPFGFFARTTSCQVAQPVLSLPAMVAGLDLCSQATSTGLDVRGVRGWRAGDQARDVHWRSTARSGRPAVVEREPAASASLVVVVMAAPTRRGGLRDDPHFERAVSAVAATARDALRRGAPTCLAAAGSALSATGLLHTGDEDVMLDGLARVEATLEPSAALVHHAVDLAGRGGAVLLVANASTPGTWKAPLLAAAADAGVNVIDVRQLLTHPREAAESR